MCCPFSAIMYVETMHLYTVHVNTSNLNSIPRSTPIIWTMSPNIFHLEPIFVPLPHLCHYLPDIFYTLVHQ